MLIWMGFLGKLIEFVATKLIGIKLDLALDEKKRACKAFLRLLDSLSELERLFSEFVKFVDSLVTGKGSSIDRDAIESITNELNDASRDFSNSLNKLAPVISLYDRNIIRLLSRVVDTKGYFGLMASQFFQASNREYSQDGSDIGADSKRVVMRFDRIVFGNPHVRGLDFTLPSEELMAVDLESLYEQSVTEAEIIKRSSNYRGTYGDMLLDLVKDKYIEIRVGPDDIDRLIELYPTFKSHQHLLRQAIDSLREFIRLNFSIEDLLYVMN